MYLKEQMLLKFQVKIALNFYTEQIKSYFRKPRMFQVRIDEKICICNIVQYVQKTLF